MTCSDKLPEKLWMAQKSGGHQTRSTKIFYNVTMNSKTNVFYNLQRIVWLVRTTHHPHQQLRPFAPQLVGNRIIDLSKEVVPTPGPWGWLRWVCSQSLTARFGTKSSDHVVELFQLGLWEAAERYLGLSFFSFMAIRCRTFSDLLMQFFLVAPVWPLSSLVPSGSSALEWIDPVVISQSCYWSIFEQKPSVVLQGDYNANFSTKIRHSFEFAPFSWS